MTGVWTHYIAVHYISHKVALTLTPHQNEPGSNDNERNPHSLDFQNWNLNIRCSLLFYPRHPLFGGGILLPTARNTVSEF